MPASLPGDSLANNILNPTLGNLVLFDLLSGPTGSRLDRDDTVLTWDANNHPVYTQGTITKATTGALSTGIGYGSPPVWNTVSQTIAQKGFTDDYKPGISTTVPADATVSKFMYIGGGYSVTAGSPSYANPAGEQGAPGYTAGFGIGAAGNGGARDAGAGPIYTGFGLKLVTASGAVATGAAIEAGWLNRAGYALGALDNAFGVSSTASAAVVVGVYA
jgi:hypothetical protein